MSRRIVIDPVTRIEGHAKISVDLDPQGKVARARFHVVELRGFEKFCKGRPFGEMPGLTSRICGICPVSHLLASAKAGDALLAVQVPESAQQLRRLMNLAQIAQSHALSFFHLSAPDLLLGLDAPPEQRNLAGLLARDPEFARAGIRLRKFGQDLIEALGGKKIHPAWAVAGGVRHGLEPEARRALSLALPEALDTALRGLERWHEVLPRLEAEREHFGKFSGLFLGLVDADGNWEHYDGRLALMDEHGQSTELDPADYDRWLDEAVEDWSYLKFPFYRPRGYPDGCYRVGPLARLNVCYRVGSPRADEFLLDLRSREGPLVTSSFFYHEARLIEIVAALEKIKLLLDDSAGQAEPWRARAGVNRTRGVGCSEAPRGTLFHDYTVDANGVLQRVNLMIATGQNNAAMNATLGQIARHFLTDPEHISEGTLNRLEAGIRAFDPCLSCSTHALGQMPLKVQVLDADGRLVSQRARQAPA